MLKRLFDIVLSLAGLLLLSPLLLCVALWIRGDSGKPVLFRQKRVGLHGREFIIYKFRTMRIGSGSLLTIGADPRVTRSGKILRKYKIDELPQLINVLRGEMSFVGPRPELLHYVKRYPHEIRQTVFSVRPGITDLASIEFRNESELLGRSLDSERTYIETILPIKLRYCVKYAQNHGMWLDMKIIAKTIWVVLSGH